MMAELKDIINICYQNIAEPRLGQEVMPKAGKTVAPPAWTSVR